jgi:RNA polymerase sigma-54 factor
MQKNSLKQNIGHKLSPQQLQFMKLLQVSSNDINTYVQKELEVNPVLEILEDREVSQEINENKFYIKNSRNEYKKGLDVDLNLQIVPYNLSLNDKLLEQLNLADLQAKDLKIGKYIIGSLDYQGYLRQSIENITEELYIYESLEVTSDEVKNVLKIIQNFDPVGIASTNLEECLITQLKSKKIKKLDLDLGVKIIKDCFVEFKKNNFEKILAKLNITDKDAFNRVIKIIKKLTPNPAGYMNSDNSVNYSIYPDFLVTQEYGELKVSLNRANIPEIRINRRYLDILDEYKRNKDDSLQESVLFVKKKIERAKAFIDAINQRQKTLLLIAKAIVKIQQDFFLYEDEASLKPLNLKLVAEKVNMDISTISRSISNKYIQTDLGIYPLKFFFSNSIELSNGNQVSSKLIKNLISKIIEKEDLHKPYTDEEIKQILFKQGYDIARRTIAKYKSQLGIPVARLRRKLD